eukprot:5539138-Pleurochrysis_carterae.AAC.3
MAPTDCAAGSMKSQPSAASTSDSSSGAAPWRRRAHSSSRNSVSIAWYFARAWALRSAASHPKA